jgi:predicted CxxxxCH...CXXCH cytochrome family protein
LTTTIWTKEVADPCALYLAFPLLVPKADMVYDSIGHATVFGRDSMPGTCAETVCHNAGMVFRSPAWAVLLATPDTPLGCVGGPALRRRLIAPYTPPNSHYYVNVVNNYWHTNFSIIKAGKLVLHHWIEPADPQTASPAMLSDELWSYPIHGGDKKP